MSGTQISAMTPLAVLPDAGAVVPVVKAGEATNYAYDIAAKTAQQDAATQGVSDGLDAANIQLDKRAYTATTLADLKAAPINPAGYIFAPPSGSDGGAAAGTFLYQTAGAPYTADGVNVIKHDAVPLTTGALVRQSSTSVTFQQAGASFVRDQQAKARESVSVLDWGAIGDNTVHLVSEWIIPGVRGRYASLSALQADYPHVTSVNDYIDWAAIQGAINWLGANNGGTAFLPKTQGRYIINRGLKLPTSTCIRGPYPARFMYNAGNPKSSSLVADFANPFQWVVDTTATLGGQPLPYDGIFSAALPDGAIYDCGVHDLIITSIGNLPYGGIRIAGAPGSSFTGVGINRVGCGALVNMTFGGNFQGLFLTAHYGFVAIDDYNGNRDNTYAARDGAYSGDVPNAYRIKQIDALGADLTGPLYGMNSASNAARSIGHFIGGSSST